MHAAYLLTGVDVTARPALANHSAFQPAPRLRARWRSILARPPSPDKEELRVGGRHHSRREQHLLLTSSWRRFVFAVHVWQRYPHVGEGAGFTTGCGLLVRENFA